MSGPTEYYQVGGFKGHTLSWFFHDHNKTANVIAGHDSPLRTQDGGIELILGVLPSGATYLLMSARQMVDIAHAFGYRHLNRPRLSTEFESLSPIYFHDLSALTKKLSAYKPKYKKGRTTVVDNSQANHAYALSEQISGISRGMFEHGRVFYRILQSNLDLSKFGLQDIPWKNRIRIYSFVFNTWSTDHRPLQERLQSPKILDIGFTEIARETLRPKDENGASLHIVLSNNRRFGQRVQRIPFSHGSTETLDSQALSSRLQALFPNNQKTTEPVILLVFDEDATRLALQSLGVETSDWESGFKALFGNQVSNSDRLTGAHRHSRPRSPHGMSRQQDRDPRVPKRSRSPPYRPDSKRPYPPVCVVDVKEMYTHLTQKPDIATNLVDMVDHLRVTESPVTGWCAGNECHLLAHAWRSMVEGPPIDDQRDSRFSDSAAAAPQQSEAGPAESNSEDPNDYAPVTSTYTPAAGYDSGDDSDDY